MGKKKDLSEYVDLGDILVNERFYREHIWTNPATGCHEWLGGRHRQGYSMISGIRKSDNKKIMTVGHRIAMRMKLGRAIGTQDFVLHRCDNAICLNPDHLILGDKYARSRLMASRGRCSGPRTRTATEPRQQLNRKYKWSEDQIRLFRTATLEEIQAELAIDRAMAGRVRWACRNGYYWIKDDK